MNSTIIPVQKRSRPYWIIAVLLVFLLNCICGETASSVTPAPTVEAVQPTVSAAASTPITTLVTLEILNKTEGYVFCYIYVSPSNSDTWGEDVLGKDIMLEPGYSMSLEIPTGVYDFRVDDCDGEELATKYEVTMDHDYEWTLTSEKGTAFCGDGTCGPNDENALNCPGDCGYCGDDICGNDEQCAEECGSGGDQTSFCGDGTCGPYDENALNCPSDCGYCGDGVCGNDEQCAEDCGSGGNQCGDGFCDQLYADESRATCPADCSGGTCGDWICEVGKGEDTENCPNDCE